MTIQPVVRVALTALAAGIGAAATQIDNETLRIVAAILVHTLAAVGIVPPQVPTKTVVHRDGERGYTLIEMLFALILLIVAIIVIFALLDRL